MNMMLNIEEIKLIKKYFGLMDPLENDEDLFKNIIVKIEMILEQNELQVEFQKKARDIENKYFEKLSKDGE